MLRDPVGEVTEPATRERAEANLHQGPDQYEERIGEYGQGYEDNGLGCSQTPRPENRYAIVADPLQPAGQDWDAAVKLRDTTRAVILEHVAEPDLAMEHPI